MGKTVKLGLILFTVTAITGLILGVVHGITAEPIRKTQERLKKEALVATLPGAEDFKTLELAPDSGLVTEAVESSAGGSVVGYNVTVSSKGYAGQIKIVVGITRDGEVKGIRILEQAETPGLGAKAPLPAFSGQFGDKKVDGFSVVKVPAADASQIQAISGATITSTAVVNGVNSALEYWKAHLAGGGE